MPSPAVSMPNLPDLDDDFFAEKEPFVSHEEPIVVESPLSLVPPKRKRILDLTPPKR